MIKISSSDLQAIIDDAITTAVERAMEMLERNYGDRDLDEQDPEDRLPPGSLEARSETYELSPEDEAYMASLDSPEMQIHKVQLLPDDDFDFGVDDTLEDPK